MLKEERQDLILDRLAKDNIIQVSDLTKLLEVTDMTIRRDLKELEDKNLLTRIHGGAKKNKKSLTREFTNEEKSLKKKDEKIDIAKKIGKIVNENKNVFLGAGTTIEYVSEYLQNKKLNIFTNSLYLFRKLVVIDNIHLNLIGGEFRKVTGAFVGSLSLDTISKMRFNHACIGVNGINDGNAFTYSKDEGVLQKVILDNSIEKYLVADSSKIGIEDFYDLYDIENVNLITNSNISNEKLEELEKYTRVIK